MARENKKQRFKNEGWIRALGCILQRKVRGGVVFFECAFLNYYQIKRSDFLYADYKHVTPQLFKKLSIVLSRLSLYKRFVVLVISPVAADTKNNLVR